MIKGQWIVDFESDSWTYLSKIIPSVSKLRLLHKISRTTKYYFEMSDVPLLKEWISLLIVTILLYIFNKVAMWNERSNNPLDKYLLTIWHSVNHVQIVVFKNISYINLLKQLMLKIIHKRWISLVSMSFHLVPII